VGARGKGTTRRGRVQCGQHCLLGCHETCMPQPVVPHIPLCSSSSRQPLVTQHMDISAAMLFACTLPAFLCHTHPPHCTQAAATAQREAAQQECAARLQQQLAATGRRHMAAWVIGRAWRRYSSSPGRAAKLQVLTLLQAHIRGWLARRQLQRAQQMGALLQQLQQALDAGECEQVEAARMAAEAAGRRLCCPVLRHGDVFGCAGDFTCRTDHMLYRTVPLHVISSAQRLTGVSMLTRMASPPVQGWCPRCSSW
jgi:hypothetical protein